MGRASVASRQVGSLTANPAYDTKEERYKVWPTNLDRAAFQEVMDAAEPSLVKVLETQLARAFQYFHSSISAWLHVDDSRAARAIALSAALKEHLRLIVLDLDDFDEPQAIFETLNANGAPLLPADLIKNWLLWEATRQKSHNLQDLYDKFWSFLDHDTDYWRKKSGTGHAARARVDTFLQNWLVCRTREPVAPKHLYDRFLRYAAPREPVPESPSPSADLVVLMADIRDNGLRFRQINEPKGKSRFDKFLHRLGALDFAAFHPLLLELMGRKGANREDLDNVAVILESYLVRRVICWDETRAYGLLAIELLKALATVDPSSPAAPVLLATLADYQAGPNRWPDNERFREQWCRQKFYGSIRRARVMMIMQALEEHYQTSSAKGEPIISFDFTQLEIEHILPQRWELHWPLPAGENARGDREHALHSIGNLTLVSGKLNPSLSNAPWQDEGERKKGKRKSLDEHAKLQLNHRLVRHYPEAWDETTIRARALELFDAACSARLCERSLAT
jgi:hypothetical protein